MIINIKGTSGSGKSTLVKNIMSEYKATKIKIQGRKQPFGYLCNKENSTPLVIPGHYESPCGGCDTIPKYDTIFNMIYESAKKGNNVLFEGLLISGDVNRTAALSKNYELVVVALDIPIEICIQSINERRKKKNPDVKLLNPTNTVSKHKAVHTAVKRLREMNVKCIVVESRELAFSVVKGLLP